MAEVSHSFCRVGWWKVGNAQHGIHGSTQAKRNGR